MRSKIARVIRKWADLIDPKTNPVDVLTVRLELDSTQFNEDLGQLTRRMVAMAKAATHESWESIDAFEFDDQVLGGRK